MKKIETCLEVVVQNLRKSDYYFFLTFAKEIWEKVGLNRKLVLIEDLTASHSFNSLLMGFLFESETKRAASATRAIKSHR